MFTVLLVIVHSVSQLSACATRLLEPWLGTPVSVVLSMFQSSSLLSVHLPRPDSKSSKNAAEGVSVWQLALQPSPFAVFPSSHCSPDSMIPLPHTEPGDCGVALTVFDTGPSPMLFTAVTTYW